MTDHTDDDMDGLSDPFSYEDLISQRAMAFYHVARLTDSVQDEAVKDLCLTMLRKLINDHQPEYIAASFDLAGPTFRDDIVTDYKANRAPMPEAETDAALAAMRGHPLGRLRGIAPEEIMAKMPDELTVWVVLRKAPPLPFLPPEKLAGYFVVTFDYRGWGASEGRVVVTKQAKRGKPGEAFTAEVKEVREVVDPLEQTTDLLNAIRGMASAARLTQISAARIDTTIAVTTVMFPYDPNHQTFLNIYEGTALTQAILNIVRNAAQAPQVGVETIAPAATKTSSNPSTIASR